MQKVKKISKNVRKRKKGEKRQERRNVGRMAVWQVILPEAGGYFEHAGCFCWVGCSFFQRECSIAA